ncbi:hypothetical protein EDC19_2251 [Natranaerovirga hydrolytica]|uniref:Phosphoesterase n=1 Tax=Natranaerovirga hydrolytica TaxID=680378 RepID=A0A4R1MJK7_9FIRM|nr:phosphodiesterase [Natranaerovirga hydrolytica]TCK90489.1 hypothetical protein EDC19_2251 [Natranaerovirga hydrolytica]
MKLIFFSDIHGSEYYTKKAIETFEKEQGDMMILLGDLLYHGPRNDLPKEYAPKKVLELLNGYKKKIIAVRGNCDSEVDQMVLEFPIMAEYNTIVYGERKIFATHGHIWNEAKIPMLNDKDILIHGHTHLPVAKEQDNIFILNPGSISLPKENNVPSYGVIENNAFSIKSFEGDIIKNIKL